MNLLYLTYFLNQSIKHNKTKMILLNIVVVCKLHIENQFFFVIFPINRSFNWLD